MKTVFHRSSEGSALLVTMIVTLMVSIILGGTLPMVLTNYRMSLRQNMAAAAFSLAEAGAEQTVYDLNHNGTEAGMIAEGWTRSPSGALFTRELDETHFPWTLGNALLPRIRIVMENPFQQERARVIVEGQVAGATTLHGNPVKEVVELTLSRGQARPHIGLIARDGLNFNGKPMFDSYNSDIFPGTYTPGVNTGSNVTVGSPATTNGAVNLGNAWIEGQAATGHPEGTVGGNNYTVTGGIIPSFTMEFPPAKRPSTNEGWNTRF